MDEDPRHWFWNAYGFQLPAGLHAAPPEVVGHQRRLSQIMDTSSPLDPFTVPIELIWDRVLPVFRDPPFGDALSRAFQRIYRGQAHVHALVRPMRDFRVTRDAEGTPRLVPPDVLSVAADAHLWAAHVAAVATLERILELAASAARTFEAQSPKPPPSGHVEGPSTSRHALRRFADMPQETVVGWVTEMGGLQAVAAHEAARHLSEDLIKIAARESELELTQEEAWALRHAWAHPKDVDPESVSLATIGTMLRVLAACFNLLCWMLTGNSLAGACPEWFARTKGPDTDVGHSVQDADV